MFFVIILGILGAIVICYAMIGYPIALRLIDSVMKAPKNKQDYSYEPTVSYMIVAHNEEKVIYDKLINALSIEYPLDKMQIVVASDNSTDNTNSIVKAFIEENKEWNIVLYTSKEHKGKTNAQNEAQKVATGEILVMTDANTMLRENAIREMVSYFTTKDVAYVSGKLEYSNAGNTATSWSESTYWNLDLSMRDIESRIKTITAGNGALYACRNEEYIDFPPIFCHDSIMPYTYSKMGKRALFNPNAIAVEKAGETDNDEFKRKVRMCRDIHDMFLWGIKVLNPIKYGWFSFFYFGHRTCRYSLWWAHILLFVSSLISSFSTGLLGFVGVVTTVLQILFFLLVGFEMRFKTNNRILHIISYYGMTVYAQVVGVYRIITGEAKPVWEKAESTR